MSGKNAPLALLVTDRGTRRLHALDAAARALGLYPGQKAADAAALVPELVTADADPDGDAGALVALGDWCVRFSPAVAIDAPDGLFLDITGVSHLWDGEAVMLDDLLARLAANDIPARGAVADTAGAAWALARYGSASPFPLEGGRAGDGGGGCSGTKALAVREQSPTTAQADPSPPPSLTLPPSRGKGTIVGQTCANGIVALPGRQAELLAPLPIAALRLDEAATAQLPRLGLTRIERLLGLPRAQLTLRFGALLVRRLDQALGQAEEALIYRRPPSPWFDRLAFAEPISQLDDLVRVAGDIAARLCARLQAEGRGGRRFELTFHRLDGRAFPVRVGLSAPGRDARPLTRLFAPKLEAIDPGFGIDAVTLTAEGVEPISAAQGRLDNSRAAMAEEGLAALIDRLSNRLGEDQVWRAEAFESHVPERAVRAATAMAPPAAAGWNPDRPRPVRLFAHPEAITAVAELPDAPPATFTWRGRRHRVRLAEGPERIAEEWWRKPIDDVRTGFVRDYYRVEDEAGGRYWIFRAGLYGDPEVAVRWWLHGVFA
ncbi:MAG: DNA polymerase Y family protein [Caulobacter sp.]|nr:DNA polymerase Y family protein [Caulobacter sp.]